MAHSGALFVCPHCNSTFGDGEALRAHCLSAHRDALGRKGRRDFDEPPSGRDRPEECDLPVCCCQKLFWDWSAEYKAAALAVLDNTALSQRCTHMVHHDWI